MANKDNEQFGLGEVPTGAIYLERLPKNVQSDLPNVLSELNALVSLGIIADYAIGGGYAVIIVSALIK